MNKRDIIMTWDKDGSFYVDFKRDRHGNPKVDSVRDFIEKYDTEFLREHLWIDTVKGERGVEDFDREELVDLAVEMAMADYEEELAMIP